MKKLLSILTCTVLITGLMSTNTFADSNNYIPDKNVSQSDMFYSNDNYNLNIDIQNTSSESFANWGASISMSNSGYIRAQGLTETYMNVDTIGYTLYIEKYQNGSWDTIKTFTYSLRSTNKATANHSLAVSSNCYYRARSVNYITNNRLTTTKTSITTAIYVN
jgi:hypothetical protein